MRALASQEFLRAEHSVAAGLRLLSQHVREGGWEGLLEDLRGLEERCTMLLSDAPGLLICMHQCQGTLLSSGLVQDRRSPITGVN